MRKLGRSGSTAMEFALIAIPFFFLTFGIFDLGRYGITVFSLRTLASEGARQTYIQCYQQSVIYGTPAQISECGIPGSFDATVQKTVAPFLFLGGLTPTVSISPDASSLTVTATQDGFNMLMPFWGTALNAPSESVSIPF